MGHKRTNYIDVFFWLHMIPGILFGLVFVAVPAAIFIAILYALVK